MLKNDIVEKALSEGKLWRAKEIVQGRLSDTTFNPDLLRQYGEILLLMGDKREAGRYLFASGVRKPEFSESIELFLGRHGRQNSQRFLSVLPKMIAKRAHLAEFVASEEFEKDGCVLEKFVSIENEKKNPVEIKSKLSNRVSAIFAATIFFTFLLCVGIVVVLGIITTIKLLGVILAKIF